LYDLKDPEMPSYFGYQCHSIGCEQLEVHDGLMRFVRNPRIRALMLKTRSGSRVTLAKTEARGEYLVSGYQLEPPYKMRRTEHVW
jgi:hypothetical protein